MANVPPRDFKRLAGSERNQPANARQVGPVDPNELIEVSVYLRDPATSSLVGDSSEYAQHPGQRITRAEYAAKHNATPFLYQNYQQLVQNKALRDVTSGNNGGYAAGPGWDACTGLGTPDGTQLLNALIASQTQA
jgi:hypothetical protein